MIRLWGLLSVVLLTGCTNLQTVQDRLNCQPALCVKDYPREAFQTQPSTFDSLLVLPPRYSLTLRGLDGTEQVKERDPQAMPESLLDTMNGPAKSYEVTLTPLVARDATDAEAVSAIHDALWAAPRNPEKVASETPVFGSPDIQDPLATNAITIPDSIRQRAGEHCCLLASRLTGWTDTKGARGAKVATAAILSALPGGSGVIADGGDVLTDMAVIRISDGQVLWSSQMLGTGSRPEIKMGIKPYLSSVYNAKYAP